MQSAKLIAKAALFNDKGKVLVLRRSQTDKIRPGDLDFAGGSVETGEGPLEAVVREIKEEIGIDILADSLNLAYSATDFYDEVSRVRFLFVGTVPKNSSITLSFEHDKYEWMSLEEAMKRYDHPVWVGGLRYLLDNGLL